MRRRVLRRRYGRLWDRSVSPAEREIRAHGYWTQADDAGWGQIIRVTSRKTGRLAAVVAIDASGKISATGAEADSVRAILNR